MINIKSVRHSFPESPGFTINRKEGHPYFTFLHFFTPVLIEENGKLIKTEAHAAILFEPGFPQYFKSEGELIHDWAHFDGVSREYFDRLGISVNRVFYPGKHEFITEIMRELEGEFYADYPGRERLVAIKSEELFIKLSRSVSKCEAPDIASGMKSRLSLLREENFRNMKKNRTVSDMAREVRLSPSRFFTLYKSLFGISPMDDLINARIGAAQNALLSGNEKIESIAHSLGYMNVTHFIRQFKKATGKTPGEYRKDTFKKEL